MSSAPASRPFPACRSATTSALPSGSRSSRPTRKTSTSMSSIRMMPAATAMAKAMKRSGRSSRRCRCAAGHRLMSGCSSHGTAPFSTMRRQSCGPTHCARFGPSPARRPTWPRCATCKRPTGTSSSPPRAHGGHRRSIMCTPTSTAISAGSPRASCRAARTGTACCRCRGMAVSSGTGSWRLQTIRGPSTRRAVGSAAPIR